MTKNENTSAPVAEDRPLTREELDEALLRAEERVASADRAFSQAEEEKAKARKNLSRLISESLELQGVDPKVAEHQKVILSMYQRVQGERGASFDYDSFEREQPELYKELIGVRIETELYLDEEKAEEMIESQPSLLALLQEYSIPGTPYSYIKKASKGDQEEAK